MKRLTVLAMVSLIGVAIMPSSVRAATTIQCPGIAQVAEVLKLATPAQVAFYKAQMAPECRAVLARDARIVVELGWIPVMYEGAAGFGGAPHDAQYGGRGRDWYGDNWGARTDQMIGGVGRVLEKVGAIVGAFSRAGQIAVAVGALMDLYERGPDAFGGGGGSSRGPGDGSR